jgi:DNA-binding response OmpR family regulator
MPVEPEIRECETENLPEIASVVSPAFADAAPWGGTETILLVEDDAFVRKVIGEALESAGYRLLIAGSAEESLEARQESSRAVDLLLADVVLPGMGGHALAAAFGGLHPHARILLMSGYAEQVALFRLSHCGSQYLAKPFSTHTLLRRVREVLDRDPLDARASA